MSRPGIVARIALTPLSACARAAQPRGQKASHKGCGGGEDTERFGRRHSYNGLKAVVCQFSRQRGWRGGGTILQPRGTSPAEDPPETYSVWS